MCVRAPTFLDRLCTNNHPPRKSQPAIHSQGFRKSPCYKLAMLKLHYTKGRTNNHLDLYTFCERGVAVCRSRLMIRDSFMIAGLMIRDCLMIPDLLFLTMMLGPRC